MLAELQRYSSAFATTEDKISLMSCVMETADQFGVYAFSAVTGMSYKQEFDEGALYRLKNLQGDSVSWGKFFEIVKSSFNTGRVTAEEAESSSNLGFMSNMMGVSSSASVLRVTCLASSNARSVVFSLLLTGDNMQKRILEEMIRSHSIIAHFKEHKEELIKITEEETAIRIQAENLENEAIALKENLTRNKNQEAASNKRLAELKRANTSGNADNIENHWTAVKAKQKKISGNAAMIPNPLHNRTCRDFDLHLLRLIKTRWISPAECDLRSPSNRVVQPYSPVEFAKHIQNFSNRQRDTVWRVLDKIDQWDYNVFELQTALLGDDHASLPFQSSGGSLFITLYALLCRYKLLQKFEIDEQVALNWISAVEAGYHGNPYHNSMHAADVVQITHFILSTGGLTKRCELSDLDVLAALLSAAIHDFDHPGINNNFHIKTGSHLATLYNDRSVLENLHVGSVFELMKNSVFNILASFTADERRSIREVMVEMVLATDMGLHGKYVARFKSKLQESASFHEREDQILALAMALKMADISNCGRPQEIYLRWSGKISDEFYQQGDRERTFGLACSPFMDRLQPAIAKGQIAFMNYIIIPFFEQVSELLPGLRFTVDLAESNKKYWSAQENS